MDNECPCCQPPWSGGLTEQHRFTHMKLDPARNVLWRIDHCALANKRIRFGADPDTFYIGGYPNIFTGHHVRRIRADGGLEWSLKEDGTAECGVGVGSSGRIATTPSDLTKTTLRVRDHDGTLLWEKFIQNLSTGARAPFLDALIDSDDNVFSTLNAELFSFRIRAYTSDGSQFWNFPTNLDPNPLSALSVSVSPDESIVMNDTHLAVVCGLASGSFYTLSVVHKDTGFLDWGVRTPTSLHDAAFMSDGGVVCVGHSNGLTDLTTSCYGPDGTLRWQKAHGRPVYCVAVDSDDNVYTSGDVAGPTLFDGGPTTRCYDKDGNLKWSFDTTFGQGPSDARFVANSMVIDSDGNIYMAGNRTYTPQWMQAFG